MGSDMPSEGSQEKHLDQGGTRALAESLHNHYGNRIGCPNCPRPELPIRAYCKDEGGNGAEGGLKRRQFRCRNAVKKRRDTGASCPTLSCTSYVKKAIETLGEDKVDRVRREVVDRLIEQDRNTSSIARKLHIIRPSIEPLPAQPSHLSVKQEERRPKRPTLSSPSGKGEHEGLGDPTEPEPKRLKPTPTPAVEQQLRTLSTQIQALTDSVGELHTLLTRTNVSAKPEDSIGPVVLDYDPNQGLDSDAGSELGFSP